MSIVIYGFTICNILTLKLKKLDSRHQNFPFIQSDFTVETSK